MNIKPIIFSKPMVMAILEGRKTMTRRVVKGYALQWIEFDGFTKEFVALDDNQLCPQGMTGDFLWVKETHYVWGHWVEDGLTKTGKQAWKFVSVGNDHPVLYCNNAPDKVEKKRWGNEVGYYRRPSIFLERNHARIFLQLEYIKIERVQDISEEDAVREGVLQYQDLSCWKTPKWLNYMDERTGVTQFIYNCDSAAESFRTLWMLINGFRDEQFAWFRNPWVWCVGFRVCTDEDFDVIAAASKQIEKISEHATDSARYFCQSITKPKNDPVTYGMDFGKGPDESVLLTIKDGKIIN